MEKEKDLRIRLTPDGLKNLVEIQVILFEKWGFWPTLPQCVEYLCKFFLSSGGDRNV
jgi:hypothetical protein